MDMYRICLYTFILDECQWVTSDLQIPRVSDGARGRTIKKKKKNGITVILEDFFCYLFSKKFLMADIFHILSFILNCGKKYIDDDASRGISGFRF